MADKFGWVKDSSMREKVFEEYQRIREATKSKYVSEARAEMFLKIDLPRAARLIGIDVSTDKKTGKPVIEFDNNQQVDILFDYVMMFDVAEGRPLRYEFISRFRQAAEESLRITAEIYSDYKYAWLMPIRSKSNFGAHCRDLLSGREFFLLDRGMSNAFTKDSSVGLATGIHLFGDPSLGCVMTGGAAIPLPLDGIEAMLKELLSGLKIDKLPPMSLDEGEEARFVAAVVKVAIQSGLSKIIRYE